MEVKALEPNIRPVMRNKQLDRCPHCSSIFIMKSAFNTLQCNDCTCLFTIEGDILNLKDLKKK